jgi:hypothetical protein
MPQVTNCAREFPGDERCGSGERGSHNNIGFLSRECGLH